MNSHNCLRFWCSLVIMFTLFYSSIAGEPVMAKTPTPAPLAGTSWLDAQESSGIIYLLFASPPCIKRYKASDDTWLPDILLAEPPTAFRVTPDALFVAFGRRASRFQPDGTGEIHLLNTNTDILSMHTAGQLLLVNYSAYPYFDLVSFNLELGTITDSLSHYEGGLVGVSIAPTVGKLFGRQTGIYPSDIYQISFSPDGVFGLLRDSPYFQTYPDASRTWVSSDEKWVVDNAGIVYNTADLTYRTRFLGAVDDIAFYGRLPIVLRGSTLIAFSIFFMETGRFTLAGPAQSIFVIGNTVYAFSPGMTIPGIEKVAMSRLHPADPNVPVDPLGLSYTPDMAVLGNDETVYLLSKKYQSIFRWSVPQRRYLSTLLLPDSPTSIAYASNENRLYVAYRDGKVNQINLDISIQEMPFVTQPAPGCGVAVVGSYVFTCTAPLFKERVHSVFTPTGVLLSKNDSSHYSQEYIWNSARRKMYFLRDDSNPNDLLWEDIGLDGQLGAQQDSPYHSNDGIQHPIRVKPDGSVVLLGSGRIYDGLTLAQVATLSNDIIDAAWKGETLFTLRMVNGGSQLQKWLPNYAISQSHSLFGVAVSLLPIQEGWLAITNRATRTHFSIWSDDFALISESPIADFITSPTSGDIPLDVQFTNISSPHKTSMWDFGDGSTSTDENPVHRFTESGYYPIKLIINSDGGDDANIWVLEIVVRPVAANFSVSVTGGLAPLTVHFTNQSTGQYDTLLWDFGDGKTSTESNPIHTYTAIGTYSITLTIDGPFGSSKIVKNNLIHATVISYLYMPFIAHPLVSSIAPGVYLFENLCQQYPVYILGAEGGQLRECIPSVEIKQDGLMVFNVTWTAFLSPTVSGCLIKYSDIGNTSIYIKDGNGSRYNFLEVGGTGYISCMQNEVTYPGYFIFPATNTRNAIFTFFDDDEGIQIAPIPLPLAP